MENNPSSSRTDRKTIERNRRNQMKALYSTLNSIVPHQRPMVYISLNNINFLTDQFCFSFRFNQHGVAGSDITT